MNYLKHFLFSSLLFLGLGNVALAANLPSVNVDLGESRFEKGSLMTFNVEYANETAENFQDVVIGLDLNVDNKLGFISSSYPIEWTADNKPFWRLGNLPKDSSGNISLIVKVSSDNDLSEISTIATISGTDGSGKEISLGSNLASAIIEEDKKNEQKEEDKSTPVKTDTESDSSGVKSDLLASGVKKVNITSLTGLADLSKYKQVDQWDKRFLYVGVIAFSLILIVGLVAFYLGKKSS